MTFILQTHTQQVAKNIPETFLIYITMVASYSCYRFVLSSCPSGNCQQKTGTFWSLRDKLSQQRCSGRLRRYNTANSLYPSMLFVMFWFHLMNAAIDIDTHQIKQHFFQSNIAQIWGACVNCSLDFWILDDRGGAQCGLVLYPFFLIVTFLNLFALLRPLTIVF